MINAPIVHDPDAVLDYFWDWTAWLGASETIASATVTAPAGIVLNPSGHSTTFTTSVVTAWISGGTVGTRYDFVCHMTTNQGRTDDRTLTLLVQNR